MEATVPTLSEAAGAGHLEMDVLVAMVEGTLAPEQSEAVLAHIDRCAMCAELIANLGSLDGPARRIGRYQIERVLGAGGMGIVYLAFDPELQRRVAVKLVRPDSTNEQAPRLILKEARTLAKLAHPNIVGVFDVGEHDGEVFLASEYIDGTTLAEWQVGRSADEIIGAWIQVAHGLAAAHAQDIVHRDVKPANVFVGRDGRVRIGDFGIAHRDAGGSTNLPASASASLPVLQADVVAGTPAYMAPEQRSGRVDARSDQFSACVALTEALTGTRPDAGDEVHCEPPALAAALTRGLRFDPEQRFPTIGELADALAAAIAPPVVHSRRPVIAAAIASVVAVAALTAVFVRRERAQHGCDIEIPDTVWSPERHARLVAQAPDDFSWFVARWLGRWAAVADATCTITDVGRRERQRRCLAGQIDQLDRLLTRWEDAPPRGALTLYETIDRLPHAVWCTVATDEPATPAQLLGVAAIRAELELLGRRDYPAVERLIARAKSLHYGPLARTLALELATRQGKIDHGAATRTLREALADPTQDFLRVQLIIRLVDALGVDQFAEIDRLVAEGRALLAKLGGDPELEAELEYHYGDRQKDAGRIDHAIATLEHAAQMTGLTYGAQAPHTAIPLDELASVHYNREGLSSTLGHDAAATADAIFKLHHIPMPSVIPPTTADAMVDKGRALMAWASEIEGPSSEAAASSEYVIYVSLILAEKPADALVHARSTLERFRALHMHDARYVETMRQISRLEVDVGRPADALEMARTAVATASELGLDDQLAAARAQLGAVLVELGRFDEARPPLELALAFDERHNAKARTRAWTRFRLARALAGVDPARARRLAQVARSEVEAFLTTPEAEQPLAAQHLLKLERAEMDQIDAWLAIHDRR